MDSVENIMTNFMSVSYMLKMDGMVHFVLPVFTAVGKELSGVKVRSDGVLERLITHSELSPQHLCLLSDAGL